MCLLCAAGWGAVLLSMGSFPFVKPGRGLSCFGFFGNASHCFSFFEELVIYTDVLALTVLGVPHIYGTLYVPLRSKFLYFLHILGLINFSD